MERAFSFVIYCVRRFFADGCPRVAASLSYSSLLASIPLLAITFGLLSYLPLFDEIYIQLLDAIFENFLPDTGLEISEQIVIFLENAKKLTGFGVIALLITVYLLLGSISASFNAIWRVMVPRPLIGRVVIQWIILSLWPFVMIGSVLLSTLWYGAFEMVGMPGLADNEIFARLLPFLMAMLAFSSLYVLLPARAVSWFHAGIGGAVAALLFEALKKGFGIYATSIADYEAVYGALASLPLALIWMYLSWSAVLIGAEIAAAIPEWRIRRQFGVSARGSTARLALALSLIQRLRLAKAEGRSTISDRVLIAGLPCEPGVYQDVLYWLKEAGYVERRIRGWMLRGNLARLRLSDLMQALGTEWKWDESWPDRVRDIMGAAIKPENDVTGTTLEDLLRAEEQGDEEQRRL